MLSSASIRACKRGLAFAGLALLTGALLIGCAKRPADDERELYSYEEQQDPFVEHENLGANDAP